ncbi:hypothetical protein COY07_01695, partial [Candidatus Peregrinibacteria bacterium CG_4_10_14_0_2_um_filter_43_11]
MSYANSSYATKVSDCPVANTAGTVVCPSGQFFVANDCRPSATVTTTLNACLDSEKNEVFSCVNNSCVCPSGTRDCRVKAPGKCLTTSEQNVVDNRGNADCTANNKGFDPCTSQCTTCLPGTELVDGICLSIKAVHKYVVGVDDRVTTLEGLDLCHFDADGNYVNDNGQACPESFDPDSLGGQIATLKGQLETLSTLISVLMGDTTLTDLVYQLFANNANFEQALQAFQDNLSTFNSSVAYADVAGELGKVCTNGQTLMYNDGKWDCWTDIIAIMDVPHADNADHAQYADVAKDLAKECNEGEIIKNVGGYWKCANDAGAGVGSNLWKIMKSDILRQYIGYPPGYVGIGSIEPPEYSFDVNTSSQNSYVARIQNKLSNIAHGLLLQIGASDDNANILKAEGKNGSVDALIVKNDGRVGIRTTYPTQALDVNQGNIRVQGNDGFKEVGNEAAVYLGDTDHYIKSMLGKGVQIGTKKGGDGIFLKQGTGYVGIGTNNPTQALDVSNGNILVKGEGNFTTTGNEASVYLGDTNHYIKSTWGKGVQIGTYLGGNGIFLQQGTGNVGIGTTSPKQPLHVRGDVRIGGGNDKSDYNSESVRIEGKSGSW